MEECALCGGRYLIFSGDGIAGLSFFVFWFPDTRVDTPSTIYGHASEAHIGKFEDDHFKHNNNPETLYNDDPDYPGGAPTGGTFAFRRVWFPGSRQAKARLVPEERELKR